MIYKCKMCGGDLDIENNETIGECQYCGSKQTISDLSNDEIARLYYKATMLRQKYDFEKANAVYNEIATQQKKNPEPYWGMVLCKYGIEYVDDPKTGNKIPVCTKISYDNVENDFDAATVLMYSSGKEKELYEAQLTEIEKLRKRIVAVSSQTDAYDIFICYKATDENGDRTKESIIGHSYYEELVAKGYKVFFSEITLEGKLGVDYEPYIYHALSTSKVLIVIGCTIDNLQSLWVKNEWARYLSMMSFQNKKNTIIPCYSGMDVYDLPEEFSNFQALNIDKLGSIQLLLDGIDKIIPLKTNTPSIDMEAVQNEITVSIKRENKKRNIIIGVVISIVALVVIIGVILGIRALITLIENNKSTTVIDNTKTIVTENDNTEVNEYISYENQYLYVEPQRSEFFNINDGVGQEIDLRIKNNLPIDSSNGYKKDYAIVKITNIKYAYTLTTMGYQIDYMIEYEVPYINLNQDDSMTDTVHFNLYYYDENGNYLDWGVIGFDTDRNQYSFFEYPQNMNTPGVYYIDIYAD